MPSERALRIAEKLQAGLGILIPAEAVAEVIDAAEEEAMSEQKPSYQAMEAAETISAHIPGEWLNGGVASAADLIDAAMEPLRSCLRETAEMLSIARDQWLEHNAEYHQRTGDEMLATWKAQAEKALALAGGK